MAKTDRPSPGVCVGCEETKPDVKIWEQYPDRPVLCGECREYAVQMEVERAERAAGWDPNP